MLAPRENQPLWANGVPGHLARSWKTVPLSQSFFSCRRIRTWAQQSLALSGESSFVTAPNEEIDIVFSIDQHNCKKIHRELHEHACHALNRKTENPCPHILAQDNSSLSFFLGYCSQNVMCHLFSLIVTQFCEGCKSLRPVTRNKKKTRDLAPKANVLGCRHCHTPQRAGGGVALSMGGGISLGGFDFGPYIRS